MKRKIFLICVLLILLVVYFSSPKEKITNKDYKLKNDNAMAVMVYDDEQDSYIKKSNIPVGKYVLNEEKSYCTYGGEITHYNRTTGTIKYKLNIGEKCYLYFDTDLTPAYAVYSETDNSLIFYKNNDSVTEGSEYNGRVVTAKYTGFEEDIYEKSNATLGGGVTTPWYEYASAIKTVSVNNKISPISTACWFYYLQNAESIDLSNLNTSSVISMERMFDGAGEFSNSFSINLGDTFNTSNVIKMGYMFQFAGKNSNDFTLDLSDKFDTSNVNDMSAMFNNTGCSSTIFELDLGTKFNTSQVTNMRLMFQSVGFSNPNFALNLGDKFDTSNVTDMYKMFLATGNSNMTFQMNLGEKFDTSKVEDMTRMFYRTAELNLNFELDLSNFTINSGCDLTDFARYSAKRIIFGDGWANATLVSNMFLYDNSTPIEIVNAPANILAYDFASDNRVVTFTTI